MNLNLNNKNIKYKYNLENYLNNFLIQFYQNKTIIKLDFYIIKSII